MSVLPMGDASVTSDGGDRLAGKASPIVALG